MSSGNGNEEITGASPISASSVHRGTIQVVAGTPAASASLSGR